MLKTIFHTLVIRSRISHPQIPCLQISRHIFGGFICAIFACASLFAQSEQIVLGEGEVLVEMVDYKRSIIIGYMVLKNGNIIKKVRFSQPKSIIQAPQNLPPQNLPTPQNEQFISNPQFLPTPQNLPNPQAAQDTQSEYEKQISQTKKQKVKKEKRSWFASRKKKPKHITANMIDSSSIPQESGAESQEINSVYKNRQWDKKKIPHNVKSQVINLGD